MLGRELAMEWMYWVIIFEGSYLRYWQPFGVRSKGLSPPVHTSNVLGVAYKQPVNILHVSFRTISTCLVYLERPHEEQANSDVEKQLTIMDDL